MNKHYKSINHVTIPGLNKFGKVEQSERFGDELHVKITEGFSINARNTLDCMKTVMDFMPELTVISKYNTEVDLFHLVLKKPNNLENLKVNNED